MVGYTGGRLKCLDAHGDGTGRATKRVPIANGPFSRASRARAPVSSISSMDLVHCRCARSLSLDNEADARVLSGSGKMDIRVFGQQSREEILAAGWLGPPD